jgi:hypothetical protein
MEPKVSCGGTSIEGCLLRKILQSIFGNRMLASMKLLLMAVSCIWEHSQIGSRADGAMPVSLELIK